VVVRAALLPPISLQDLERTAALTSRVDRKYLVTTEVSLALVDSLSSHAILTIDGQIEFAYESVYFDTPDRLLHRQTAQRRRRRFRVRTRHYAHSDTTMLEVKVKGARGMTIKHRHLVPNTLHGRLDPEGHNFIRNVLGDRSALDQLDYLEPTLTTRYRRLTIVDSEAGTRFTHDRQVQAEAIDGRVIEIAGVIVETKTPNGASAADRWLWAAGRRPLRFSKYCTMLAELEPNLPRNKWHSTLSRSDIGQAHGSP